MIVVLVAMPACGRDGGERGARSSERLEVPGGAEATTPASSVPEAPLGGATATAEWASGRAEQTAQIDDEPSACRVEKGPSGWSLVVDIGPDEPGPDRASDALRLRIGPLARLDQAGVPADGTYLADVESIELHVGGGDPPTGETAADVIASVTADLTTVRMPLGEGSLEVTCGS